MTYTIRDQPHLFFESIEAMHHIYTGREPKHEEMLIERSGGQLRHEELQSLHFGEIAALMAEIAASVDLTGPMAELLFKERGSILRYYAFAFFIDELNDWPAETRAANAIFRLLNESDLSRDLKLPFESISAFAAWLQEQDYALDDKYDCLQLYSRYQEFKEYLLPLVEKVSGLIERRLPFFEEHIARSVASLRRQFGDGGVAFLKSELNFTLDEQDDYMIIPSVIGHNSMYITSDILPYSLLMAVGINIFDLKALDRKYNWAATKLPEFLKLLSDSTKLSILQHLRQERAYSGQLADALGLSGPTISHHMSLLTNLRLVGIEKLGNRIYYELDTVTISAYLEELRRSLLG